MSDGTAAKGDGPFEEQRQIYDLLSQETRHLIVQLILGHPEHLVSLDELAYMMSKNKATIRNQLEVLVEANKNVLGTGIDFRRDVALSTACFDVPSSVRSQPPRHSR